MRDGMAESGTCRRFSRLALMSAVRSGGSSVTCGTRASLAVSRLTRTTCGGSLPSPASPDRRRANDGALVVAVAGNERDGIAADRKFSLTLDARAFRVPEIVQPVDQLSLAERLSFV